MSADNVLKANLEEAAGVLRSASAIASPRSALCSGRASALAEQIENAVIVPFGDSPYEAQHGDGSQGSFRMRRARRKTVLAMQRRLHGYEGNSPQEVAFPIWLMHLLGVRALITTNAAGAINESYVPGEFCIMSDHINFTGRNPIVGTEPDDIAFRFFSMKDAYDPELRAVAHRVADARNVRVQEGVYLGLLGPSFETPAEIRAFRAWGADTVAMSVCEEVIAARHVGMRVLGISLVSNMACGVEGASPSDVEVFEVAKEAEPKFCRLVEGIVEEAVL